MNIIQSVCFLSQLLGTAISQGGQTIWSFLLCVNTCAMCVCVLKTLIRWLQWVIPFNCSVSGIPGGLLKTIQYILYCIFAFPCTSFSISIHCTLISSLYLALFTHCDLECWSPLMLYCYFLINPPENSSSSPNGEDQTPSPAHWGFHTPPFHLRIDLLKDTRATRRTCMCQTKLQVRTRSHRGSQSEYSRPLNLKCSLRLARVF